MLVYAKHDKYSDQHIMHISVSAMLYTVNN